MTATLISKLAAASIKVGALATDKRNTQQGYNYISADKILDRAGNALAGVGIVIIPAITKEHIERVQTDKGGTRYDVLVKFVMTITDGESTLEYPWVGLGSDYVVPNKAFYKAVTSGHRYFLTKLLNIGVGNEDGEHESEPQQKPQERTNADGTAGMGAAVSQPAAPARSTPPGPTTPAMEDTSSAAAFNRMVPGANAGVDGAPKGHPLFGRNVPWYAATRDALTPAIRQYADMFLALHRNNGGPASAKAYGYLAGLLDSIIEQAGPKGAPADDADRGDSSSVDGHKRVLSVLCQTDVSSTNRPSATMTGRLLARLATHIKDDAGTKVANPNYDQSVADACITIYHAAKAVATPSLLPI